MEKKTKSTTVVDENHTSADFQQKITYSKSESEIVPSYTVSIPLTAELQKESSTLSYSLALENDTALVPSAKGICNNRRYKLLPQSDAAYRRG